MNMVCIDNIEDGAKMHGLEDDEIEELIEELRKKSITNSKNKQEIK
jgi:hypothetical protein